MQGVKFPFSPQGMELIQLFQQHPLISQLSLRNSGTVQDRRLPHGLKLRKPSEEDDRKAVFGGEALAKVNKLNVRFDEGELEIEH